MLRGSLTNTGLYECGPGRTPRGGEMNAVGCRPSPTAQAVRFVPGLPGIGVGARIKFAEEKRAYQIRARSERYLVCTKPHNPLHTVLYTIVDLDKGIRGPEGLVFGLGQETDEECRQTLERIDSGESEISYRHRIPLAIEWIKQGAA